MWTWRPSASRSGDTYPRLKHDNDLTQLRVSSMKRTTERELAALIKYSDQLRAEALELRLQSAQYAVRQKAANHPAKKLRQKP